MSILLDVYHEFIHSANGQRASVLSLMLLLTGFLSYHYLNEYLKKQFQKRYSDSENYTYYTYLTKRFIGFLAIGLIPLIIFKLNTCKPLWFYGLNMNNIESSLLWIGILGGIISFVNYFAAGSPENIKQYPQIRITSWSAKNLTLSSISWIIYLLGYEIMFRGILLFSFYHEYGMVLAVTVNIVLYALVHLPKGRRETLGSIPLGIILCLLAIHTGSFLVAFVFHVIMALTNDFFAIKRNPEMTIKIR